MGRPKKAAQTAPESPTAYVVKKGDTLDRIAEKTGVPWRELVKLNGLASPNILHVGQKLKTK